MRTRIEALDNIEPAEFVTVIDEGVPASEMQVDPQDALENIGRTALSEQVEQDAFYIGAESDNSLKVNNILNDYDDYLKAMLIKISPNISYENMQDVLQEVRIRIWRAYENFRGDSSIPTWCWVISKNALFSFLKKEGKRGVVGGDVVFDYDSVDDAETYHRRSPILNEDHIIDRINVLDSLKQLDEKYSEVLKMQAMEFSTKEIAEFLDMNENTVKTLTKRGREKLKELSERDEDSKLN